MNIRYIYEAKEIEFCIEAQSKEEKKTKSSFTTLSTHILDPIPHSVPILLCSCPNYIYANEKGGERFET